MAMEKAVISKSIYECCAFAVVRTPSVDRACEIAEGCLRGGVNVLEISYTLPNAGEVIAGVKERFGRQIVVGAGTVMDAPTARLATIAGAEFVVANCLSNEVATLCNRYQIPYAPGCTTVTEAMHALEIGAAFIKCFPISNFYGPKLASIFKTPTPWMPLMASGGINLENLAEWVRAGIDCCGIGGLLTEGSAAEIAANAAEVRRIIDEVRAG
ncbi:2-keto-3-deoxy-phosphogluconate aldolase [Coriobacterium glomerans PW2]|uniref:2-keto-3-deoxy-phosphogluconate aldolase n=2 Tax=Coriobacterium TaxID=33870 RepID=F2NAW6_CORGP|nr:ketohydroxyglutarate aldolase [Coriobacterium glomerans]AEB07644.1 2-keto-3-deoxy-phosphogluconate aldolase [Coriobacterium glomerans PW2]